MIILALCMLLFAGCRIENEKPLDITPNTSPDAPTQAPLSPTPETAPTSGDAGEYWVLFFNAGKADCALICANGTYYLVDTGTKDGAEDILQKLALLNVTALSGIFLTHTHSDHAGGAKKIAAALPVAMFYRAAITTLTDKGKDKLTNIAGDAGVPETKLSAEDVLDLNGARAEVLAPLVFNEDDDNDNSLVFRLTANGHSVLFTGDMQFQEEATLMGRDLSAEVLKVGNHGNPDATSEAFAAAVNPEIAVISTNTLEDTDSANPRVITALEGAKIYNTEGFTMGVMVDLSYDEIIVRDPGFDPGAEAEALRNIFTGMLVNREHLLGEDYVPEELVSIADYDIAGLALKNDAMLGYYGAVDALAEMMRAAGDAGVSGFYLASSYRTYQEQRALWNRKVEADADYGSNPDVPIVTAYPGASEHQTGLAFDISAVEAKALSASFVTTKQGMWLYANSWRYGFIVRYPESGQEETGIVFEPWHFRYVGKPLAAYLYRTGMTLEAFYGDGVNN